MMVRASRVTAVVYLVLACAANAFAQTGSSAQLLKIVVIAGEGAVNVIQQKTAVAPVVEIRDRNDAPVSGASVTFSLNGGRASFAGSAKTITLTTDSSGRASVSELHALSKGRIEIRVRAELRGQSVTRTIAQTNVATAAEAAQVAVAAGAAGGAAGAVATGAGAAAGGGGSGLSATTIGIIGGAAAGGTVVAVEAAKGNLGGGSGGGNNAAGTTYTGPINGQYVVTTVTASSNGGSSTCQSTRAASGTMKITLHKSSDGTVTGQATTDGTMTEIAFTQSPTCSALGSGSVPLGLWGGSISGTTTSFTFSNQSTGSGPTPNGGGTVTSTTTVKFTGSLFGDAINGTIQLTDMTRGTNQVGPISSTITGDGALSLSVTLR